jgi:hypothetical protein
MRSLGRHARTDGLRARFAHVMRARVRAQAFFRRNDPLVFLLGYNVVFPNEIRKKRKKIAAWHSGGKMSKMVTSFLLF